MLEILFVFWFSTAVFSQESRVISINDGDILGYKGSNGEYFEFLGIPYAAPPAGQNRFKDPEPPVPWTGIFNASNVPKACPQTLVSSIQEQDEDCLNINVYVPESASSINDLPVLFFIHGGGYRYGSGYGYDAWHTVRHNIILVTFNYRLNIPGFLCLGTEQIPGNAGIKDQVAALKWTYNNIAAFGGDPEQITIYGESAGGASAEILLLTPLTNGLYKRAIIESGSVMTRMGATYNPLGTAKAFSLMMDFLYADQTEELENFYLNLTYSDWLPHIGNIPGSKLYPCVEKSFDGLDVVYTEPPQKILKSASYDPVNILFVYTENEGRLFLQPYLDNIDDINSNFDKYFPDNLWSSNALLRAEISQNLKALYFENSLVDENQIKNLMDYSSDALFTVGVILSALEHSKIPDVDIYVMEFAYSGGFNQPNSMSDLYPELYGASHADIVAYVMDLGHYNNETIDQDQIIRDRMTEMWTNFVKYGDPTPDTTDTLPVRWLPFKDDEQYYLRMESDMIMRTNPLQERLALWRQLYEEYYWQPPVFGDSSRSRTMLSLVVFGLLFHKLV